MDVKIAIEKVLQLFNGHDELILAFNTFVPQNLQITLEQIVEMRIKRQKKKKESNDRTGGKRKRKVVPARKPKKKKKTIIARIAVVLVVVEISHHVSPWRNQFININFNFHPQTQLQSALYARTLYV